MVPGNGNDPKVVAVEAALRQLQSVQPPAPAEGGTEPNIMALMQALAKRCRAMADTLASNASSDRAEADEFCRHLIELSRRWGGELLARKRQELAELEQFLGRVEK
jgi:hypothetical protein